ncbi:MAG: TRAP transporter small permease [Clostridia bacterium]|nr:TRAP transporter small permease [Clostridia bacterium]
MKAIQKIEKFFQVLDKIVYYLAAAAVAGMLACVTIQVIARHTSLSINWTTELSQYCFLWSTCFASYIAARRGKLIGVELVQKAMPTPVRRGMKFISWIAAAFFYSLVIYFGIGQVPSLMKQLTPMLKWPMGMIYIIMMLGLLLVVLFSLFMALKSLVEDDSKKENTVKTAEQIAEEVE